MGRISALTELTSLASDDYLVVLDSSANIAKKITVANAFGIQDYGWTASGESWTYSSYSSTTKLGVITVPTDATTKYSVGMFIKITQSTGGVKYGEITAVSSTTLTVFFGSYTLNNEAITSPQYSISRRPYGLPESTFQMRPFTPTLNNFTLGNGTATGFYSVNGKICTFEVYIVCGSTTAWGSGSNIDPPVAINSRYTSRRFTPCGEGYAHDSGTQIYMQRLFFDSATASGKMVITSLGENGTRVQRDTTSAANPFTIADNDTLAYTGWYEIA